MKVKLVFGAFLIFFCGLVFWKQNWELSPKEAEGKYLGYTYKTGLTGKTAKDNFASFVRSYNSEFPLAFKTNIIENSRFWAIAALAAAIFIFFLNLSKISGTGTALWAGIALTLSPWWYVTGIFDLAIPLTILLVTILIFNLAKPKLVFWISLALMNLSFPGLIASGLGSFFFITSKQRRKVITGTIILLMFAIRITNNNLNKYFFFQSESLNITSASDKTLQRFKEEYKINNFRDVLPVSFRRVAYNKYFYLVRQVMIKLAATADFEKWTSPSQTSVTVANNFWIFKGVSYLPIIILLVGLLGLGKIYGANKLVWLWGITSGFLGTYDSLIINSAGVMILFAWGFGAAVSRSKWWMKIILTIILVTGSLSLWYHFLFNPRYWRDNKPTVMARIATLAESYPGKKTVTEILGPTRWYFAWNTKVPPESFWENYQADRMTVNELTFAHFELKNAAPEKETTYIGFPGEFIGNRSNVNRNDFNERDIPMPLTIIKSERLVELVSFGNGDFLWVAK